MSPSDPIHDELRNALLETNRALGGAHLILDGVLDGNVTMERVDQESQRAHARYWETRRLLEGEADAAR